MIARILIILSVALLGFSIENVALAAKYEIIFDSNELLKAGQRSVQKGKLEDATYYYEKALKRRNLSRPDMIQLRSDLCVTYMYLDRFEEALEQCILGIRLMPNRWQTLNNLGTVYLVQGDFESAIASYEKALKMKPNSRVLKFNHDIATQRAAEFSNQKSRRDKRNRPDEGPGDYGSSTSIAGLK